MTDEARKAVEEVAAEYVEDKPRYSVRHERISGVEVWTVRVAGRDLDYYTDETLARAYVAYMNNR